MQLVENDKVKLIGVVSDLIKHSTEIQLAIAFVRKSGVNLLSSELQAFKGRGGSLKLIFGEDFNLTDSSALDALHRLGAEMKVYLSQKGVYHPKIWMFKKNDGTWAIVIGSSNMSKSALTTNVEASWVFEGSESDPDIRTCLTAYDKLWKSNNSQKIDQQYISEYKDSVKRFIKQRISISPTGTINTTQSYNDLKEIVKNWIDIPVDSKYEGNRIWRGWYFLPDQQQITPDYLLKLQRVLVFIKDSPQYTTSHYLDIPNTQAGERLCEELQRYAGITYVRQAHRTTIRERFIRQQRNYLEHFGLINVIERTKIQLTELGTKFSTADVGGLKEIYEGILAEYKWYEVHPFLFLLKLLLKLPDNTLLFWEFSHFVAHAKHDAELDGVCNSIMTYRLLTSNERTRLNGEMEAYLEGVKGGTASGVEMNYYKKLRFFLRDITALDYLQYNETEATIKLTNTAKAGYILTESDYITE